MGNLPASVSRRDFLRGRKSPAALSIRPPWAAEQGILSFCTKCNKCQGACPENIITTDAKG